MAVPPIVRPDVELDGNVLLRLPFRSEVRIGAGDLAAASRYSTQNSSPPEENCHLAIITHSTGSRRSRLTVVSPTRA